MTRMDKATNIFFWAGYVVFLAASIPHVADYFYHFDGSNASWYTVAISYGIAIVIDVSDVLISIAVMREQAKGAKIKDTLGYWFFIAFIMGFSWIVNWQFDKVHQSTAYNTVDKMHLIFTSIAFGTINPILGSSFQVLLFIYTGMAHKFGSNHKTSEALKAEIKRLEEQKDDLKRLNELRKSVKVSEEPGEVSKAIGNIASLSAKVVEQRLLNAAKPQGAPTDFAVQSNAGNTVNAMVTQIPDPQTAMTKPEDDIEEDEEKPGSGDANKVLNFAGKDQGKTSKIFVKEKDESGDTRGKIIAVLKRYRDENKKPNQQAIATELNISRQTVFRHMQSIKTLD